MRIAVTRPEEDAQAFAECLRGLGHEPLIEPLLRIVFPQRAHIPERNYGGVLVTSANGVRGLEKCKGVTRFGALPVYAVGAATAMAARQAGFGEVHSADGDLAGLLALVSAKVSDRARPLLYAAGRTVSDDLEGILEANSYQVERCVLYCAEPATAFSAAFRNRLAGGEVDAVTLFSPRSARIWVDCTKNAGLRNVAHAIMHFCLSDAVADTVHGGAGGAAVPVRTAATPDLRGMLGAIRLE